MTPKLGPRPYTCSSRLCGEYLGIKIWDDWGIHDPEAAQLLIRPHDSVFADYSEIGVEQVLKGRFNGPNTSSIDRYHVAMGMVSQYTIVDILFFLRTPYERRSELYLYRVQKLTDALPAGMMCWVPAPSTLEEIEKVVFGWAWKE
jgi:hypothetical protein